MKPVAWRPKGCLPLSRVGSVPWPRPWMYPTGFSGPGASQFAAMAGELPSGTPPSPWGPSSLMIKLDRVCPCHVHDTPLATALSAGRWRDASRVLPARPQVGDEKERALKKPVGDESTLVINPGLSDDNIYAFSRSGRVNMRVEIDGGAAGDPSGDRARPGPGPHPSPGFRLRRPAPGAAAQAQRRVKVSEE